MDRFRQIIEFTKLHLSQLSPTQKMLIGSCVIVIAMTFFIVSQYAGRSHMVPLGIGRESVADAMVHLDQIGISYEPSGGDLLVATDQHMRAVQELTQNGSIGTDAIQGLIEEIQSQQWWAPREQNRQAHNAALSKTLTTIIKGWSYVSDATVLVQSSTHRPAIGKREDPPTASAVIRPKGASPLTDEQVRAIADFIAGAVPNLSPADVRIVDDSTGRSRRVKDSTVSNASTYSELQTHVESLYENKIYDLLRFIPGVIVAVNAQLDIAIERRTELDYKSENSGTVLLPTSEMTNSLQDTMSSPGGVAGVEANTGTDLQSISRSGSNGRTQSESKSEFEAFPGQTERSVQDPKGYAKKVRAAVTVPRSFYERIWQQRNPDATDPPDDAALTTIIDAENQKIVDLISQVIDTSALAADDQGNRIAGSADVSGNGEVSVQMYHDFGSALFVGGDATQDASVGGGFLSLVRGDLSGTVKTIAMSAVALVGLFLMFRLIRGATGRHQLPSAEELVGIPPSLDADEEDLIGTASGSEPAMDALELDDDELRSRNLTEQLREMVKAQPADAARLVSKWVKSD